MKQCTQCAEVLPLSEFYRQEGGGQGVTGACRRCSAERRRGYAAEACSDPAEFIRLFVDTGQFAIRQDGTIWQMGRARGNATSRRLEPLPAPRQVTATSGGLARNRSSYYVVRAGHSGRWFRVLAHRLVWAHFVGPIPPGMEINHINGVRSDNRPGNLEVVSRRRNALHARDSIGRPSFKLDRAAAGRIRARYAAGGIRQRDLADAYGVSQGTISDIIRGRRWQE